MSDLTVAQVKEYVDALEKDADHKAMREDAAEKIKVIQMLKAPDPPQWMKDQGIVTSEPSPFILWLAGVISADCMPYPTIPTVTPLGDLTLPAKQAADKIEAFVATWRATCDDGRRVSSDVLDNQLLSPYSVMMLRCGSPDEDFPWRVETPDPLTCFFPIERAPFRPEVLGRRYKQLVRKVEKTLSSRKQYDSEAKSWAGPGSSPSSYYWKDGTWGYVKAGTERVADSGSVASAAGPFEDCEMYELHIEDMVYICAMNAKGNSGEMVWKGKSMTGGVSAVVVPGRYSSVGPMSERMQAALWPAIQMVHRINEINSFRATRSAALKPDILVEESPEMLKAQQVGGTIAQGQNAALEAGGPNIINVRGKPTLWPVQDDPDLDKREQSAWKELDRYVTSWSEISEAQVVKETTANAFLTNLESTKRQKAPMLAHRDWGWNELAKMALHSIVEYDKPFSVYAVRGDEYKEAKKGEGVEIKPAEVEGWDDKFFLVTETRSTTEAETRARIQDWAYRKGLGLSGMREGITAAGYTDEGAQIEALAVEAGIQTQTQWIATQVATTTQERIRLRAGVILPIGPPPPAVGPVPTNSSGGGAPPMRPAAVPGASGGSGGPM